MCVYGHILKKIRVGRSEVIFLNFIFHNYWMASRMHFYIKFEEWHLTLFCQNNDPLDIKNYIGRQKKGIKIIFY